jgi:hypothetical protein
MTEPLATYLHDHLAGSNFAIDLLESLRDRYAGQSLGQFASNLLAEIQQDRNTLKQIADRVGKGTPDLKEAAAWLAEKASRLKLSHDHPNALGTFQALETLALGILGKLALWRALTLIADIDDRLSDLNLPELIRRAEAQHAAVEEHRLLLAPAALTAGKAHRGS